MSASLALQGAVVARLKADGAVSALLAVRIYDRVPAGAPRPYLYLREFGAVDDGADCLDGLEIHVGLDIWSDAVGKPQAARIAEAVRLALHEQDLTLAEPWALVDIAHRDTAIGDEDGLLVRARMSFRALVERI